MDTVLPLMRPWHNLDMELPPPLTAIEVVRYVHTIAEWPAMCHRVVSTVHGSIPRITEYLDVFTDLPPRQEGMRSAWWRLTEEWVSNAEAIVDQ